MILSENFIIWFNVGILVTSIALVLIYGNDRKLKLSYSVLNTGLLTWLITLLLYYSQQYEQYVLLFGRFNFVTLNISMIGFYFFVRSFSSNQRNLKPILIDFVIVAYTTLTTLLILSSPLMVAAELVKAGGERETLFGPLFFIYLLGIPLVVISAAVVAIKEYKKADKKKSTQMKIFLWSTIATLLLGGFTNLILPQIGIFTFQKYGTLALTFLDVSLVFLIIRYQFLNIKILLGRLFYYLILVISTLAVVYLLNFIDIAYLNSWDNLYKFMAFAVIASLFVLAFNKLNSILQKQVITRFINPGYDPYVVVEEFNSRVSRLLTLEDIQKELLNTVKRTLRPYKVEFYILNTDTQDENIQLLSRLWKKDSYSILQFEKLSGEIRDAESSREKDLLSRTYEFMDKNGWRLINAITDKDKLIALLIIGQREMDLAYSQYDLEFLTTLSHMIGVSITRSILYREVENFNEQLKQEVAKATKELGEKVVELEAARKRERDMMDIMGHELRTPLSIIKVSIELLILKLSKIKRMEDLSEVYLKRIQDALDRETRLLEAMLDSTKLEAEKMELHFEKVDLISVINDSILAMRNKAQAKNLQLNSTPHKNDVYVYADRVRLAEVVDNFVLNAVKYTEKGSITIKTDGNKDHVYISVIDTGIGIPKEDLAHLGEKFYRVGQYSSDSVNEKKRKEIDERNMDIVRPGGTGLGLYVSYNLVKLMGGEVKVESTIGKGSIFTFTVPKYENQKETHLGNRNEKDLFKRLGFTRKRS